MALIEFNGEQHYKETPYFNKKYNNSEEQFKSQQERDAIKTNYCLEHNIPYLVIKYTELTCVEQLLETFINTINKELEMDFETEMKLFESEEKKERVSTVPSDRAIMFSKLMKMVNVSPADLQSFLNSKESDEVGWTAEEAKKESVAGNFGLKDAKMLVNILKKGKGVDDGDIPNLSDEEWQSLGRTVRFIARFRNLSDKYKDDEGNKTPLYYALYLRAFDPIKAGNKKLPSTQEVKQELKKELEKEIEKKINETVSLANLFL